MNMNIEYSTLTLNQATKIPKSILNTVKSSI